MVDLTNAAKPKCLTMEGYEERYNHIQQFGARPAGNLTAIKLALLDDLHIVDVEPMISAETAVQLKGFLNQKLELVKSWSIWSRPGRHPHD